MMGQGSGGQKPLFYSFNLDDHVPADHLLRGIDGCLDLGELRRHLAPFYSDKGRPSIDPQLMVRMLIVGYSFGIRSERRLCEEVHLNLAYRWFCRLGLEDAVPDHSTDIPRAGSQRPVVRHRHEPSLQHVPLVGTAISADRPHPSIRQPRALRAHFARHQLVRRRVRDPGTRSMGRIDYCVEWKRLEPRAPRR